MKRFSQDIRDEVVKSYDKSGMSTPEICKKFGVSAHTLYIWLSQYGIPTRKRRIKISKSSILEAFNKNPYITSVELRDAVSPDMNMHTFFSHLRVMGIKLTELRYKKCLPVSLILAAQEESLQKMVCDALRLIEPIHLSHKLPEQVKDAINKFVDSLRG